MPFSEIHVIILAGGRIKGFSAIHSKGLISLDGKPAIWYLLKTLSDLNAKSIEVVFTEKDYANNENDKKCFAELKRTFNHFSHFACTTHDIEQSSLNALYSGLREIKGKVLPYPEIKHILVLCGDVPLIQYSDLDRLLKTHKQRNHDITLMCVGRRNPFNYGVIYNEKGKIKIFEREEFERYLPQIRKKPDVSIKKFINVIKKMKLEQSSNGRYLNNVGPILFSKNIFINGDEYQRILEELKNNSKDYYTRILDYFPEAKVGTYLVQPKEITSTVGFDSYYEYIGTSARIHFLKDKYERKLTANFLINQFKELYSSKFNIADIINQIECLENKGSFQEKIYDIHNNIYQKDKLTNFQKFIITFIKDYESYKKDLIEIIFDTLKYYQDASNFEVDIIKKLEHFRDYEVILYKNKSYRDHLIHVFQVFLLGMYVLEGIRLSGEKKSKLGKYLQNPTKCDEIYMLWYYASLYHDICYPMEKASESIQTIAHKFLVEDIIPQIGDAKNPFSIHISIQPDAYDFNICVYNFVKPSSHLENKPEARTLLCGKLLEIFYKSFDHGIGAAINLCHLINKNKPPRKKDIIYKSILAIALHTIRVINKIEKSDDTSTKACKELKTIFNNNNMLRLLIFCDNVQEWGRPDMDYTYEDVKLENITIDAREKMVSATISCKEEKRRNKLIANKNFLDTILQKAESINDWKFSYDVK